MFKYVFAALYIATCFKAEAIQIIHAPNSQRNSYQTHQLNMQEEQQEMLRQQLRIQQEMLDQYKQNNRYGR